MPGISLIRRRPREAGTALFTVTLFALVAMVLIGTHLSASLGKVRHVNLTAAEAEALNAAEAGLGAIVAEVWTRYREGSTANRVGDLAVLDGSESEEDRLRLPHTLFGSGTFDAEVTRVVTHGTESADVEFTAHGRNRAAVKTVRAIFRFGHRPSEVFDHAYFINNFGWFHGAGITINGSARSNGDFSVKNPTLNGDLFASENEDLSAKGTITGDLRTKDTAYYTAHAPATARPTDPCAPTEDLNGNGVLDPGEDRNGNGGLDTFSYPDGFDGTCERRPFQQMVEMPYLGQMEHYEEVARERGGTLTLGGRVIVNAVFGDDTGEGADLALVGTAQAPIVIHGPVVVRNDVALKGVITGQGTIYAGRNLHIIGDLRYANPPSWPKPTTDPAAVQTANSGRDLVGLVARGSVILGNCTNSGWKSTTRDYLRPPFTQDYVVDEADSDIGYASFRDPEGEFRFDGDYTDYDGGRRASTAPTAIGGLGTAKAYYQKKPTTGSSRRYYESSFQDSFFSGLCDTQVQHVDGIMYTNHLLVGKLGATVINGSIVGRDEAMIYTGSIEVNYDVRLRYLGHQFIDIYLPRVPTYWNVFWSEGQ